ncbi:MAG: hypothetical protein Q8Q88_05440 [Phenylobacterium sp.]|uniref:lipoate--protein ligase family protein n=1 Tax=Phenylobacterium sp. TaxID=1871053 RepID=UPI0027329187|nr:hypothetical protein [Phenylobacterium sp.]MDP3746478.1 hypothetical protein [Phenylobacterium sp.]
MRAALLAEAPEALMDGLAACPQAAIDRDLDLLEAALGGEAARRVVRIWANPRCVVLSRRLAARGSLGAVADSLAGSGAAVAMRASGGTAVVHRPGVLNVSVVAVDAAPASMVHAYTELTGLLSRALARLGIETQPGAAAGACCDGDHNLLWRGRKLAGTAAVVRRRGGRTARLVHASLTIWGDLRDDLALVARAEACLTVRGDYVHGAHATLAQAMAEVRGKRRHQVANPPRATFR